MIITAKELLRRNWEV
ncbi:hypothetical protein LINPERHAP1_LOCUS13955 [Linum perenne]